MNAINYAIKVICNTLCHLYCGIETLIKLYGTSVQLYVNMPL